MKISFYFLDGDPDVLSYVDTEDDGYVNHDEKTVTIKVYLWDMWGASNGCENRTYPRDGHKEDFKVEKKKIKTVSERPVKPWVIKSMREKLLKKFPNIGQHKIPFERK